MTWNRFVDSIPPSVTEASEMRTLNLSEALHVEYHEMIIARPSSGAWQCSYKSCWIRKMNSGAVFDVLGSCAATASSERLAKVYPFESHEYLELVTMHSTWTAKRTPLNGMNPSRRSDPRSVAIRTNSKQH